MKRTLFFFILFTFSSLAQSTFEKLDRLLIQYADYKLFNGSVLVADSTGIIYKKGFGFANMEWKIQNASDVKFRIGSIGKQFTALLILQLVQEGKIDLEAKIVDYLDYYRKDSGEKVSIHHLLNHTSGIPSYTSHPDFLKEVSRKYFKPDDFVKEHCMGNLEFEPGSSFAYNNSGYFILGAIIEKVTGKSFEQNLLDKIFIPLQMNSSGYDWSETIVEKRASGYEEIPGSYINAPFLDMSIPFAAGSIYSTVEDLFLWDRQFYSNKLLNDDLTKKYFFPYIKARGGHYAYGWFIYNDSTLVKNKLLTITKHGGSIHGFNTLITRVTDDKKLIVLLNNTSRTVLPEIENAILKILYGLSYKNPQIPISLRMKELEINLGISSAITEYKRIIKEEPEFYDLRERELNYLGHYFLLNKKFSESVAILQLNVEMFPESFSAFESLGKALLTSGQKDKAIESYRKALSLNPRSVNAAGQLNILGVFAEVKKDPVIVPEILKTYEGKYQLSPNLILTITTEKNRIFAQGTGQPIAEIFPESETKFYIKVVNAKIEFEKGNEGDVKRLILYQDGQTIPAPKIK